MVDPSWDALESLNPVWRDAVYSSTGWVDNFLAVNKDAIEAHGWTITKQYYRAMPRIWGILIDNSSLFACTAYWQNGRMRGGQNPTEQFKKNDARYGTVRITEFCGWFDFYWQQGITEPRN